MVELGAAQEDLEVAQHVDDEVEDEDRPGHRHDGLLADGGAVEPPGQAVMRLYLGRSGQRAGSRRHTREGMSGFLGASKT